MYFGLNVKNMKRMIGVSEEEFERLVPLFEEVCKEDLVENKKKNNKMLVGKRHKPARDMLFFILFFLRVYPTCYLGGFIFKVDEAQISRWTRKFLPLLEKVLERECVLPKRKISSFEELENVVGSIFPDGTERKVYRKSDYEEQKKDYSGKKKCILTRVLL